MSTSLGKTSFENVFCAGGIYDVGNNKDVTVFGKIKEGVQNNEVYFFAANPPDYRATYTGSGLPYANNDQAFDNTPNKGKITLVDNTFEINLMYPNSYYVGLGTVIVPPTVYLQYKNNEGIKRNLSIKISDGIPYRMLSYPMSYTLPRKDAMFYKWGWGMPVRSQEQILRDSAYPSENKMAENFWGLKPPM
jgi:hypothetical protein